MVHLVVVVSLFRGLKAPSSDDLPSPATKETIQHQAIFILLLVPPRRHGSLFPIYVNTLHGLRSVDSGLIEMGRVYGLRSWSLFRQVILPGALPSILVGIRFALGIMWLTLIVAETIAADAGIGYMAMNAREFMQTDVVVLSIVLYALFGKLADVVARWLERICLKWNPNYQHV